MSTALHSSELKIVQSLARKNQVLVLARAKMYKPDLKSGAWTPQTGGAVMVVKVHGSSPVVHELQLIDLDSRSIAIRERVSPSMTYETQQKHFHIMQSVEHGVLGLSFTDAQCGMAFHEILQGALAAAARQGTASPPPGASTRSGAPMYSGLPDAPAALDGAEGEADNEAIRQALDDDVRQLQDETDDMMESMKRLLYASGSGAPDAGQFQNINGRLIAMPGQTSGGDGGQFRCPSCTNSYSSEELVKRHFMLRHRAAISGKMSSSQQRKTRAATYDQGGGAGGGGGGGAGPGQQQLSSPRGMPKPNATAVFGGGGGAGGGGAGGATIRNAPGTSQYALAPSKNDQQQQATTASRTVFLGKVGGGMQQPESGGGGGGGAGGGVGGAAPSPNLVNKLSSVVRNRRLELGQGDAESRASRAESDWSSESE